MNTIDPTLNPLLQAPSFIATNPAEAPEFKALLSGVNKDPVAAGIRIKEVSQEFEGMFLGQMLAPMFEGLKSDAPFGGGSAETTWRSLLVQEYGKAMAKRGGIGIAPMVEKEMRARAGLDPLPSRKKYEVHA
jgi:Rod binding domain-containing protein